MIHLGYAFFYLRFGTKHLKLHVSTHVKAALEQIGHRHMKRVFTVCLVGMGLVVGAYPAQAGGRFHSGYHHGYHSYRSYHGHRDYHGGYRSHRYNYGHRHGYGDDILIGAGIIGGSILLGSLLSQPNYYSGPAYYAPPRAPICEQDRVYRYLPDGRVQWGTRTRCY